MQKIQIKSVLKIYWQHVRPYKWSFFAIMLAVLFASGSEIIIPLYYKKFFDLISIASPDKNNQTSILISVILMIMGFHLFSWVAWRTSGLFMSWRNPQVLVDLSRSALDVLHKHSHRFFLDHFAGSLVRRVGRLERSFDVLADQLIWKFFPLTIVMIGFVVVLTIRHPIIGLILAGWTVLYILINFWYSLIKYPYDEKRARFDSESTGVLSDSITNATTVKLFTGVSQERLLYHAVTEKYRRLATFTWRLHEYMEAGQALFMIGVEFVLMYIAVRLWKEETFTIGDFIMLQGYLVGLFNKLWDFGKLIRHSYEALADASEMVEIMEKMPDVMDVRNAKPLDPQNGRIEFRDVYFNFNETRPILKGFNLMIEPGEKVGLVGPSGAGKSTIAKLLLRLYDIDRGKIIIGNQNIAKVTQESLRSQIAVVPQEPILFHRTIMDNLRYGRRNATDEEVIEAAKKAQCHDFISELQNGYETYVGERGVKLSGGERQRVAIARAILKNVSILVLDEATSSLDSASEALIQTALHELMEGRTTIVIAHRLSTIMEMDRIVVVDSGRVVDEGTHEQLLKHKKGIYKNLWEIQAGGFLQ